MDIYSRYSNFVTQICQSNNLTMFKSHPDYTYMLEHVSKSQGHEYIYFIKSMTNISDDEIKEFCMINDSLGNPNRENYGFVITSPTSLRYIFQAHLILSHLCTLYLPSVDIVEVGGGYGGLCLAIHHFSNKYNIKINTYSIVDLPSVSKLQKLYLSEVNPTLVVDFVDANTFGVGINKTNMFLVSNYCFSEIPDSLQKNYIANLFPKVSHGFMAWNFIPTYNFGFKFNEEVEYPKTGEFNKYLRF